MKHISLYGTYTYFVRMVLIFAFFSLWSCNRMDTRMGNHTASTSSNAGKHIQTADEIELESFCASTSTCASASTRSIACDLEEELDFARDISVIIEQLLSIKRSHGVAYSKGKAIIDLTTFCVGSVSAGMLCYLAYRLPSFYADHNFSLNGFNFSLSHDERNELASINRHHLEYEIWWRVVRLKSASDHLEHSFSIIDNRSDIHQFINEQLFKPRISKWFGMGREQILKIVGLTVVGGIVTGMAEKIQYLVSRWLSSVGIIRLRPGLASVRSFSDSGLKIFKEETLCALRKLCNGDGTLADHREVSVKHVRDDLKELFEQALKLVYYLSDSNKNALEETIDKWDSLLEKLDKAIEIAIPIKEIEMAISIANGDHLSVLEYCKGLVEHGIERIQGDGRG